MISTTTDLVGIAESYRIEANLKLDKKTQIELGQFMTPSSIAQFMASLFEGSDQKIRLLDPGAGVGSLTASFIAQQLSNQYLPSEIAVDAYELDAFLLRYLKQTLKSCSTECANINIDFIGKAIHQDFVASGTELLWNVGGLFQQPFCQYTHCIMNPPYKKIRSDSQYRRQLSQIQIETSNLYSAFIAIAIKLLAPNGQLVAIIPRSFCNGVYFKPFRQLLLSEMAIEHLHVFTSRTQAFKENDVLQENIILHAIKHAEQKNVTITASSDPSLNDMTQREVSFDSIIKQDDPDQVIHITSNEFDQMVIDRISSFSRSLDELGISVSTGPVVDFRLKDDLRQQPENGTVPLIYPSHFEKNQIRWPAYDSKKPNAIFESVDSSRWLMPNGWYVLTRRLSSTEEKRRIVAAIYDPQCTPGDKVGFENHINVFHIKKNGLDAAIAKGLAVYLNSTLVDLYFRQFSGHTQVNATDLRMLHYPDLDSLIRLGRHINGSFPTQGEIDAFIDVEIKLNI